MTVSLSIVSFLGASLVQWSTVLAATECWGLTIVRSSLLMIGQIVWARKIWAKHDWEHDLLTRLGDCYTSAQHFSLSEARRIDDPRTSSGEEVMLRPRAWFFVKGVTMCTLYSPVACCGSKPQHCTLFRGKFGSVIYGTDRNRWWDEKCLKRRN